MYMRSFITLFYLLAMSTTVFAEPTLEKLWQSNPELKVPESVLYDVQRQVIYTSNINGEDPWAQDGNGSIGKLSLDGTIIAAEWVAGLNSPKGMGISGNFLYVTDNQDIVTIDIENTKITNRFTVPNSKTINDLSVSDDGTIYVTDSTLGSVHKLVDGKLTTIATGLTELNGVLHSRGELLVASNGGLHTIDAHGKAHKIADGMEGIVDGIERVDDNAWLVSCWLGTVYYVERNGNVKLLLDGRPTQTSAADLGYDPVNRIAYFPGFWSNFVTAYKLK